jgi:Domain of unknown function (DUF4349)
MRAVPLVPERRVPILAAGALLFALACSRDAASPMVDAVEMEGKLAADMAAAAPEMSRSRGLAMEVVPPQATPRPSAADSSISTMLIRRGDVSVRVDSLEPAMDALRRLASSLGGTVGNVSITAGEFSVRTATLELRIPAPRFDAAMGGLAPIGKVEHSSVTAEDVGEEYVDVRARVANARRLETRLIDLLATRTGKLEDVLAVERELARVREEIERNEGRMRWLGARVATSTVSVTVSEKAPIVGENPGQSVIGQAFVRAWQNFIGLVAWVIASLGVLVPVAVVLWLAARWWQGRRKRGSMEA